MLAGVVDGVVRLVLIDCAVMDEVVLAGDPLCTLADRVAVAVVLEIAGALAVGPMLIARLSVPDLLADRSGNVVCRIGGALRMLLVGAADAVVAAVVVVNVAVVVRPEPLGRLCERPEVPDWCVFGWDGRCACDNEEYIGEPTSPVRLDECMRVGEIDDARRDRNVMNDLARTSDRARESAGLETGMEMGIVELEVGGGRSARPGERPRVGEGLGDLCAGVPPRRTGGAGATRYA